MLGRLGPGSGCDCAQGLGRLHRQPQALPLKGWVQHCVGAGPLLRCRPAGQLTPLSSGSRGTGSTGCSISPSLLPLLDWQRLLRCAGPCWSCTLAQFADIKQVCLGRVRAAEVILSDTAGQMTPWAHLDAGAVPGAACDHAQLPKQRLALYVASLLATSTRSLCPCHIN